MRILIASIACTLILGCGMSTGSDGSGPDMHISDLRMAGDLTTPPPFCSDGVDGGPAPTLANVEQVFDMNCALSGCHDAGPFAAKPMIDLRPGHSWASLVNVPAAAMCGGTRVVPGDPSKSYLMHKLTDATPCDGVQMPRCEVGSCPIPNCQIDVIRRWIAAGALQ